MISSTQLDRISANYRFNKEEFIEVEARFGSYRLDRSFNSDVPYIHFDRLLRFLKSNNKLLNENLSNETTTISQTSHFPNNVRKITTTQQGDLPEKIEWQTKKNLTTLDLNEFDIRISVNLEFPTEPVKDEAYPSLIRERIRHSFVTNLVRIDLTEIISVKKLEGKSSFEVEVEFVGERQKLNLFNSFVEEIFKILKGTNLIYSNSVKNSLIVDLIQTVNTNSQNRNFNKFNLTNAILVKARNIKRKDLVFGGIVGNENTTYCVTYKADGVRKLLIIHPSGIWLIFPPFEFNLIFKTHPIIKSLSISIFDGELLSDGRYLAFDTISLKRTSDVQSKTYLQRLAFCQYLTTIFNLNFIVETKETHEITNSKQFFTIIREMLSKKDSLTYKEDGLIFTPTHSFYNPHSDNLEMRQRSLTLNPDVCKYKSSLDITIDFMIMKNLNGISLYSYDDVRKQNVLFEGDEINPFSQDMIEFNHEIISEIPSEKIVEFEFINNKFRPRKVRNDKSGPNKLTIALDDWKDIMNPILREDIEGRSLDLAIAYHNRIKSELFRNLPKNSHILDIGSGRGGDITKWLTVLGDVGKVVAVEPNESNRNELIKRLKTFNLENRTLIVPTVGEDVELISKSVTKHIPSGKVDVISLMLSMSFFWKSEENLDSLVETIIQNLKLKGRVIFLTINGDTLEQLMEPVFERHIKLQDIKISNAEFHLHPKVNNSGRSVDFTLPDSIVGTQREYLVKINDLTQKLRNYGFNLTFIKRASEEKLLSDECFLYSSLYSYGEYIFEEDIKMSSRRTSTTTLDPSESADKLPFPSDDGTITKLIKISDKQYLKIPTIGDGHCLIHSVLKAIYTKYQETNNKSERQKMAGELRSDMADKLKDKNPDFFGRSYWESIGNAFFVEHTIEDLENIKKGEKQALEYTSNYDALNKMLKSSGYLGNESFVLLSVFLKINLFIKKKVSSDMENIFQGIYRDEAPCVIVIGNGCHFELIGLVNNGYIQTWFDIKDKIIDRKGDIVKNQFKSKKDYLEHIKKYITDHGLVNSSTNRVIIPENDKGKNLSFQKDDPFLQLILDCGFNGHDIVHYK